MKATEVDQRIRTKEEVGNDRSDGVQLGCWKERKEREEGLN